MINKRILAIVMSMILIIGAGGFYAKWSASAEDGGGIEVQVLDSGTEETVAGACIQVTTDTMEFFVCDALADTPPPDGPSFFDHDRAGGSIQIPGLSGIVTVQVTQPPPGCALSSDETKAVTAVLDSYGRTYFTFYTDCDNSSPQTEPPDDSPPATDAYAAQIRDLETQVERLTARVKTLEAISGEREFPAPLNPETDVVFFGNLVYPNGDLPPDKSIFLLCQRVAESRPGGSFEICGWWSTKP